MSPAEPEEIGYCPSSPAFYKAREQRQFVFDAVKDLLKNHGAVDREYESRVLESISDLDYQPPLAGENDVLELEDNVYKTLRCQDGKVIVCRSGRFGNITWYKDEAKSSTSAIVPWWVARLIADRAR